VGAKLLPTHTFTTGGRRGTDTRGTEYGGHGVWVHARDKLVYKQSIT